MTRMDPKAQSKETTLKSFTYTQIGKGEGPRVSLWGYHFRFEGEGVPLKREDKCYIRMTGDS